MTKDIDHNFFIWGGWYGSTNIGDRTLLISIMDLIMDDIPNATFTIVSASPEIIRSYLPEKHAKITNLYSNKHDLIKLIRSFSKIEAFIFGGGVPFYDDPTHSLTIILFSLLAKLLKVPMIAWAVSSQNVQSKFTRWTIKLLVKNLSIITCRDKFTKNLLVGCGAEADKVQIIPDPGYSLQKYNFGGADTILEKYGYCCGDKLVALVPRTLRPKDGESHTHYSALKTRTVQKEIDVYARFLDIIVASGFKPIFLPMNTTSPDDDRQVARSIVSAATHGKSAILIDEKVEFGEVIEVFTKCEFTLTSRIHGSINSYNGDAPWIMFSFDQKYKGLMSALGLDDQLFDAESMEIDRIDLLAQRMIAEYQDRKLWIAETRPELINDARIPIKSYIEALSNN